MKPLGRLGRGPRLVAALCFCVPLALAQGQGGGGAGGGTSGGGTTGGGTSGGGTTGGGSLPGGSQSSGRGQTQPQPSYPQQQTFPEIQRPIFLQGKVVFEDGTPVPPNVIIERVCGGGRAIPETYTDAKGRFSFQVGQNRHMVADASYSSDDYGYSSTSRMPTAASSMAGMGGFGERDLIGCSIRATLAGYRSNEVELSGRRALDNPDIGTIVLRKLANVEGFTISATTIHAPKKAQKAFQNGVKQAQNKKWDKAQAELLKAVGEYPEYAVAWLALGEVYEAQGKAVEARDAYVKSLAADEKFVGPRLKIARMDVVAQKWSEVVASTDRVLRLNPYDFPDAYFYNSVANLNLQNAQGAEKSAREAIKMNADKRFPQLENILGLALAQQGNFEEANEHLKKYLELFPNAGNADVVREQIAQLEREIARSAAGPRQ